MTSATGSRRSQVRAVLVLGLALAAVTAATPAASELRAVPENLDFRLTLSQSGPFQLPCPVGSLPADATACVPYTGKGSVRGLGKVSATFLWVLGVGPPACPTDFVKSLATTGRLDVAGKGTIVFTAAEGERCVPQEAWAFSPQALTTTGGTGPFAAASGTVAREGGLGKEAWKVTLAVPGLAFDLTAPRLFGTRSKTIRAPKGARSARAGFEVTATDGVDGTVPVSCRPRSGSRFSIGRTTVRCEATDSSGNAGKAAFTVTVERGR